MTSTQLSTPAPGTDYASVARDRTTGDVLIALTADAAADLQDLLSTIDVKDMVRNPDAHGLDGDTANNLAAIARTLQDLLNR